MVVRVLRSGYYGILTVLLAANVSKGLLRQC